MFPVIEEEKLKGCVLMDRVKDIPTEQRDTRRVGELVQQCTSDNTVAPGTNAMKALRLMEKTGNDKLMVVEDSRLEGIVTRNDILRYFAAKNGKRRPHRPGEGFLFRRHFLDRPLYRGGHRRMDQRKEGAHIAVGGAAAGLGQGNAAR
jgi:hypothetical protein